MRKDSLIFVLVCVLGFRGNTSPPWRDKTVYNAVRGSHSHPLGLSLPDLADDPFVIYFTSAYLHVVPLTLYIEPRLVGAKQTFHGKICTFADQNIERWFRQKR